MKASKGEKLSLSVYPAFRESTSLLKVLFFRGPINLEKVSIYVFFRSGSVCDISDDVVWSEGRSSITTFEIFSVISSQPEAVTSAHL